MICAKCGAKNFDSAAFCENCGNSLKADPSCPKYAPAYSPPSAPVWAPPRTSSADVGQTVKTVGMVSAAVAALFAVIILFTSSGYSSPEAAAEDYIDGLVHGDYDQVIDSIHPEMVNRQTREYVKEACEEWEEDYDYSNIEIEKIVIDDVDDVDDYDYDYDDLEDEIEDLFDIEIEDARKVTVYVEWTERYPYYEECDREYTVFSVKIDGDWYAFE